MPGGVSNSLTPHVVFDTQNDGKRDATPQLVGSLGRVLEGSGMK